MLPSDVATCRVDADPREQRMHERTAVISPSGTFLDEPEMPDSADSTRWFLPLHRRAI